ncbi:MAG TPA: hypothetical protein VEC06_13485 [Paucimonas sp.]|nr:hypothetical protein [Paucimonas sp.]
MLFLKSTVAPLAPGLYLVDIAAKPPGRTFGVFIAVDADNPPQDLINSIEAMGFRRTVAAPYTHQDGKKVLDLHYHKAGTDIFDGWTLAERDANLKALEELFGKLDIKIQPRTMTLAEAFA